MKTIEVDAAALQQVLSALVGPAHLVRELQAMYCSMVVSDDPISTLVDQYITAVAQQDKACATENLDAAQRATIVRRAAKNGLKTAQEHCPQMIDMLQHILDEAICLEKMVAELPLLGGA